MHPVRKFYLNFVDESFLLDYDLITEECAKQTIKSYKNDPSKLYQLGYDIVVFQSEFNEIIIEMQRKDIPNNLVETYTDFHKSRGKLLLLNRKLELMKELRNLEGEKIKALELEISETEENVVNLAEIISRCMI